MTNLFISDLHLDASQPAIYAIFKLLLAQEAKSSNHLFILGDLFESWIGDDDTTEFHQMVINDLRLATQRGLNIFVMHGNRDFLLGKDFFAATGCRILPDEYIVSLAGKPTLLMHGDTLCTADKSYLRFRAITHIKWLQKLFLLQSLSKRQAIAEKMRAKSQLHTQQQPLEIMDVSQAEVERIMLKHSVLNLIHGHTHRPATHRFELQGNSAQRTVLGAWHDEGNMLICDNSKPAEYVILR